MNAKPDRAAWLKGGNARCNVQLEPRPSQRRYALLGAPGVGKGTQAGLLADRFGLCPLSTGDVFRSAKDLLARCECSPALLEALVCMNQGQLVPDDIVLALLDERGKCLRCGGGFLLDGFPRTVAQAEALGKLLTKHSTALDGVLSYELPIDRVVARLSGRRVCPKCKGVFHIDARPPRTADCCDQCGTKLQQRDDDRPEAIRVRMDAYEKSTAPLVEYYQGKGLLIAISAEGTPEEIFDRTLTALQTRPLNGSGRL